MVNYTMSTRLAERPQVALTCDIVCVRIKNKVLQVLLIRRRRDPFKGSWALPGGFVEGEEGIENCARRELLEETGLKVHGLCQIGVFDTPGRDPRGHVVSIAYVAPFHRLMCEEVQIGSDAEDGDWFNIGHLPSLAFDHGDIISAAHHYLRGHLHHLSIISHFYSYRDGIQVIQDVYDAILGKAVSLDSLRLIVRATSIEQLAYPVLLMWRSDKQKLASAPIDLRIHPRHCWIHSFEFNSQEISKIMDSEGSLFTVVRWSKIKPRFHWKYIYGILLILLCQ